jgi:hypothetical protein
MSALSALAALSDQDVMAGLRDQQLTYDDGLDFLPIEPPAPQTPSAPRTPSAPDAPSAPRAPSESPVPPTFRTKAPEPWYDDPAPWTTPPSAPRSPDAPEAPPSDAR